MRVFEAGLLILALGVGMPIASAVTDSEAPALLALVPSAVQAHRPTTLTLEGRGFVPETSVLIETGRSGKFLRYRPTEVGGDRCVVSVPSGFPERPAELAVFVENPDGSRSERLPLAVLPVTVGIGASTPDSQSDAATDGAVVNHPEVGENLESGALEEPRTGSDEALPAIREIRPAEIPAGRPLILEVFGAGFDEESKVLVTANLHAGSSRLPEYALKAFPSYFIDAELIEVEFDLGFYPIPGARDVVVENASGGRSEPAILQVTQSSREQEE